MADVVTIGIDPPLCHQCGEPTVLDHIEVIRRDYGMVYKLNFVCPIEARHLDWREHISEYYPDSIPARIPKDD